MNKSNPKNKDIRRYMKIPYDFLGLSDLQPVDKLLAQHISNFKENGCYQNNEQLAKTFGVSIKTISRSLQRLIKKNLIYVYAPKGFYRRIWNLKYKYAAEAMIKQLKAKSRHHQSTSLGQNDPVRGTESPSQTGQNYPLSGTKSPTIIKDNIKEDYKKDYGVTPTPLPAERQASALLKEPKKQDLTQIERIMKGFGKPAPAKPTPKEIEKRKQVYLRQLKSLRNFSEEKKEKYILDVSSSYVILVGE